MSKHFLAFGLKTINKKKNIYLIIEAQKSPVIDLITVRQSPAAVIEALKARN